MRYSVLILAILVLPLVSAADIIKDVTFSGDVASRNAEGKTYAVPNREGQAQMQFTVLEPYNQIILDMSALNKRPRSPQYLNVNSCTNRVCTISLFLEVTASGGQTFRDLSYIVTDINGEQQRLTQRFYVDTIKPQLVGIGTPFCQKECSLRNGENTITIHTNEKESGLDPSTAMITVDDQPYAATRCTVNTCDFTVYVDAAEGQKVNVQSSAFTDRAGNTVTGATTAQFKIDNKPPTIAAIKVLPDNPVITGPFSLQIMVDDNPPVHATVDVTSLVTDESVPANEEGRRIITATCNAEGTCTVPIRPTIDNAAAEVLIEVSDSAGNKLTTTKNFNVARRVNNEGEFWDVALQDGVQPDRLDKGSMKFFKKNFYMPLELSSTEAVELGFVQIKPGSCKFSMDDDPFLIPIKDLAIHGTTSDKPVLFFTIAPTHVLDEVSGELDVECTINTYTIVDGELYDRPEEDTVRGTIRVVSSPLLPDRVADLQKQTQEDLDDDLAQLQQMKTLYSIAEMACGTQGDLRSAIAGLTLMQAIMSGVPGGDGAALQLMFANSAMDDVSKKLSETDIGQKLCAAVTCEAGNIVGTDTSFINKYTTFGLGEGRLDSIASFTAITPNSQQAFFDPYKSQYVAYMTGCLPAILYHQETKMSIQCSYNSCIQQEVNTGLPVSICAEQRSDANCRYVTSGMVYALPVFSIAQTIRDNVVKVVTNPVSVLGFGLVSVCDANVENVKANALCKIEPAMDSLIKTQTMVSQVKQAIDQARAGERKSLCEAPRLQPQDALDRLPDNFRCGSNHCELEGFVRIGNDFYRKVPKQELEEKRQQELDAYEQTDEWAVEQLSGHTLQPVDEDQVPNRVKDNFDLLFETFGMSEKSFDELLDRGTISDMERTNENIEELREEARVFEESRLAVRNHRTQFNEYFAGRTTVDPMDNYISSAQEVQRQLLAERARMQAERNTIQQREGESPEDFKDRQESTTKNQEKYLTEIDKRLTAIEKPLNDAINLREEALPNSPGYRAAVNQIERKLSDEMQRSYGAMSKATNDEAKRAEKENRERIKDALWAEQSAKYGSKSYRIQSGVRTALKIDRITSAFGINKYFDNWYGRSLEESGVVSALSVDTAINAICEARSDLREMDSVVGFYGEETVGLYLHGVRADPFTEELDIEDAEFGAPLPVEPTTRYYTVGGRMLIPPRGFTYYLELRGDGDVPITQEAAVAETGSSAPYTKSWTGNNLIRFESEKEFTHVCIVFDRPINELLNDAPEDNEECVELKVVNE